jgi:hypothetical protein
VSTGPVLVDHDGTPEMLFSQAVKAYNALIALSGFVPGLSNNSISTRSAVKSLIARTGTFFLRTASSIELIIDSVSCRREPRDHQTGALILLEAGPHLDLAIPVLILGNIHQTALEKVRIQLERLFLQNRDLRLEQFAEVVRKDAAWTCRRQCPRRPASATSGSLLGSVTGSLRARRNWERTGQIIIEDLLARQGVSGIRYSGWRRRGRP